MVGTVTTYAIFWEPTGSYVSPSYNHLILRYFNDIGNSPLYRNLKQYSNSQGKHPIRSVLDGSWVDTQPYPGNPLQGSDIQNEVSHAMQVNGWTPSIHKLFFVFTAKGEILCLNRFGFGCSFSSLCAWGWHFGTDTIYSAQPYADTDLSACGVPSSPNHDFDADSTINLTSHEQMDEETNPLYNGWFAPGGNYNVEIADQCQGQFGSLNQYGGDVLWHGHPYMVQKEWDNATSSCVLNGP